MNWRVLGPRKATQQLQTDTDTNQGGYLSLHNVERSKDKSVAKRKYEEYLKNYYNNLAKRNLPFHYDEELVQIWRELLDSKESEVLLP
jgi:hypothetical protein